MVAENLGSGESGGIDILQLAAAAKESLQSSSKIEAKPPQSIVVDTDATPKKQREKKTVLLRKGEPSVNECAKKIQNNKQRPSRVQTSSAHESTSHKGNKKDWASSVLILKRDDVKAKPQNKQNTRDSKSSKKTEVKSSTIPQFSTLQQELLEVKKRLEQEKAARKLSEANCQKTQRELESTRQTLEHETQFRRNCQRDMDHLKEELEQERALRKSAQDVESNIDKLITEERKKVKELDKHLQLEQQTKESIMKELEVVKAQLLSEKNLEQSLRDELNAAHTTNESLAQKMEIDSASSISMKMELHSMKSRMGKVEEVEQALKQEILKVDRLQNELAKADAIKAELEEANEKLTRMDNLKMELLLEKSKVQALEAKLDDQVWCRNVATRDTRSQSISSSKYDDLDEVDIHVERLRKELHETREALKNERKKNATLIAKKTKTAEVSCLKDWIDLALPSAAEVNMPPATEVSLSDGPKQPEVAAIDAYSYQNPVQPHYFDGTKNEFCGEGDTSPLDDELTFIMSAYSSEEVIISKNKDKLTYFIDLPTNNNDEVQIKVVVRIPKAYPEKGMLGVEITLKEDSNCSSDMRKYLLDSLPNLSQMCLWEVEANYGQEALFSVLNMADRWAQTEWPGILSKHFPSFKILQKPKQMSSQKTVAALIYTHHLIEPDKLQLVKKITSKLSLGGIIKSGKPGVILIASVSEADCETVLNELKSQASQKIFRSTAFKLAAKVNRKASDLSVSKMSLLDNNKDGMDELTHACEILGLADALQEII
jgi:hypothetical protein